MACFVEIAFATIASGKVNRQYSKNLTLFLYIRNEEVTQIT